MNKIMQIQHVKDRKKLSIFCLLVFHMEIDSVLVKLLT